MGRSQEAWWWQPLQDWVPASVHLHLFVLQQELLSQEEAYSRRSSCGGKRPQVPSLP